MRVTQTSYDKEGFVIRDPNSTTYTGAIETVEEFGRRIYFEAGQRGWRNAVKKLCWATALNGYEILPACILRGR
jgi:hypothetical protein